MLQRKNWKTALVQRRSGDKLSFKWSKQRSSQQNRSKYSPMTYLVTSSSLLFQNWMFSDGTMAIKTCSTWWCLVVIEYMVFSARPHYSALVMSCILPAPEERCAPRMHMTSSLQVMSSSERTGRAPPQLGHHKGPSCRCARPIGKLLERPRWTGSMFPQTKRLMTYFTVGLAFCPHSFCVPLGVLLILRDDYKSLP